MTITEEKPVTKREVQTYRERGHIGFIMDYRAENGGADPDPKKLDQIGEAADKCDRGIIGNIVMSIVRVLK